MFEGGLNTLVFRLHLVMFCGIITVGSFEFLNGSRITCIEYFRKVALTTSSKIEKRQRLIAFTLVNAIRYPHTLKNNIYHSIKRGPPPFSHMDTNPVLGHVLVHSFDKTHVLVVIVELIWLLFLNIFSFNFVPTLNKSLRFIRFRRSYVNSPAVSLTKVIKVTLLLRLMCAVFCSIPTAAEQRFLLIPI